MPFSRANIYARDDHACRRDDLISHGDVAEILPRLEAGERVVLASDAGLPALNDPGARLIEAAVERLRAGGRPLVEIMVPLIAMSFSTWLEDYRWTPTAVAGAILALGGMVGALSRNRSVVPAPDAA